MQTHATAQTASVDKYAYGLVRSMFGVDNLYDEVRDLRSRSEEELMRDADGDMNDVSSGNVTPHAAPDGASLQFVFGGFHRLEDLAAGNEVRFAALDDEHIGLGLVDLDTPIAFAVRDGDGVVAEVVLMLDAFGRNAFGPDDDSAIRWRLRLRRERGGKQQSKRKKKFHGHPFTMVCFAMNAGSISIPSPGPAGTVMTPLSSERRVDVAQVYGRSLLNSLNS